MIEDIPHCNSHLHLLLPLVSTFLYSVEYPNHNLSQSLLGRERLVLWGQHMFLLDPPHETRPSPIDDSLHLYRRIMDDLHFLPSPSNEVDHLIRSSLECMPGLRRRREPKEVSRLDFLLPGLRLPVLIENGTRTFSGFDYVEPFVFVAMPVWDSGDVVGRYRDEVDASLGQATLVTEVQPVPEDARV